MRQDLSYQKVQTILLQESPKNQTQTLKPIDKNKEEKT
jgi:hypothetical protein